MSDIQLYLLEYEKDQPEAQRIAARSAQRLEYRQLKLIDLITSLEQYINNKEDGSMRARSVAYLADVLDKLPSKVLSGQERRLLVDFVLSRIEGDVEGIGASSRALIALEKLGKWDRGTAEAVMQAYLTNAYPLKQFKLQTERFAIIQLLDMLVAKYRDAIKQLHESDADFLSTFTSFFEGEKDPRNLMIIFSILHVPMAEWDVQRTAQDLFEAVFNYFPITFKPPPDDPYGITAQDLKDRLRACIAANSDFAPYSFPALLDKLDSSSMNTKRDVLHAIQACVASYGPKTVNLYSVTLWDALKFEILNVQEEDLAEGALKALAVIALTLSGQDAPLKAYLRPIIKECNEHLEDAPTKQSQAAGRILFAVAASAPLVADKIAKGVLGNLFTLYNSSESITKRRGLLEVSNDVLKAFVQLDSNREIAPGADALQQAVPDALEAMLRALISAPKSEVSFRLTALEGLTQLIAIAGVLSEKEVIRIVDAVTDVVLHERIQGHGDIRHDAIKTLTTIARYAPGEVRDRAVPAFMVALPDVPVEGDTWEPVLEAFAQLSNEQQIFDTITLRLKNKSSAARHQGAPKAYQHALLLALLYAFTYGSPARDDIIRDTYFADYVVPLMVLLRAGSSSGLDDATLEVIGRLCNTILRPQSMHFQASVYNENLAWMSPAQKEVAVQASQLSPFLLFFYAALKPEVVDAQDIASLLQSQARYALSAPEEPRATAATLQLVSLLIDKFIDPKAMLPALQSANIEVESLLQRPNDLGAMRMAFAVVKALLVQGKTNALTRKYLDLLLQMLPLVEDSVARKFATLLAPDDILVKENHCIVSGLYKQKTFNQLVPALVEAVRTSSDELIKTNYLIALSGILRWLPYTVLESSLRTLIPPLLQSLDLADPRDQDVKASTLAIFEAALLHNPDLVAEHTASLVARLLSCTTATATTAAAAATSPGNPAAVRAKALECLALVPHRLRRETVLPHRRRVVKQLLASLDDARRGVRGQAVKCRRAWLGLEEEEEEE